VIPGVGRGVVEQDVSAEGRLLRMVSTPVMTSVGGSTSIVSPPLSGRKKSLRPVLVCRPAGWPERPPKAMPGSAARVPRGVSPPTAVGSIRGECGTHPSKDTG
jgi:hypothetical protein